MSKHVMSGLSEAAVTQFVRLQNTPAEDLISFMIVISAANMPNASKTMSRVAELLPHFLKMKDFGEMINAIDDWIDVRPPQDVLDLGDSQYDVTPCEMAQAFLDMGEEFGLGADCKEILARVTKEDFRGQLLSSEEVYAALNLMCVMVTQEAEMRQAVHKTGEGHAALGDHALDVGAIATVVACHLLRRSPEFIERLAYIESNGERTPLYLLADNGSLVRNSGFPAEEEGNVSYLSQQDIVECYPEIYRNGRYLQMTDDYRDWYEDAVEEARLTDMHPDDPRISGNYYLSKLYDAGLKNADIIEVANILSRGETQLDIRHINIADYGNDLSQAQVEMFKIMRDVHDEYIADYIDGVKTLQQPETVKFLYDHLMLAQDALGIDVTAG